MNKRSKQVLALLLVAVMLIGTGVPVFAANSQTSYSVQVNKPEPKTVASEAQSKSVSTFAEFKSAVEAGTPVKLTADITATGNVGSTSKYIDADIVIYGNGKRLNMGAYQFLLSGSHTLSISDLKLETANTNSTHRYGVFCIRAGSATSKYVWDTQYHNFTFLGSALLGVYNTDDYTNTTRMFNSAIFTGNTNISITNGYNGYNGVVYARNISISDKFVMTDEIKTTNTGASNSTYQHYFKSPGTGGVDSEPDNSVAYGTFYVDDNASVTITRSPGRGTDGQTSAYYRSLIYGYADHSFGEGANFTAKAGTNLTSSSGLEYRSAVIRSNNASSFLVGKNADVNLETDLYNTTTAAKNNGSYGYTALYLKKSGALTILVDQGATLDIKADGRNTAPSYGTRAQAPVVIRGSGSSSTTVYGDLKVYSENGNGWYYDYSTSSAGKAAFTVGASGVVTITANNLGVKGANEYAAFEAYGKYDVDITVKDGGKMTVFSNGYRGMSLAGAGGYNMKNILVTGAGSVLKVSGVHWAIAAETQPVLSIAAENGGMIELETTGDIGEGYSSAGSAPSTIYSVGPTTYNVDGAGSKMDIRHSGGTYSAIFHDGYGPLKIYVTNGAAMSVDNKNSGTDTSARRAAITAQSTGTTGGSRASYDNEIVVTGAGSYLTVTNNNPYTHGNGGDTGLYPTGAVAFNSTSKGNIRVADGGSFKAVSSSLAPTIHMSGGKITFDNPGEFEIRNNSTSSSTGNNTSYATFGQAVYNERYRKPTGSNTYPTAIEFKNASVSVWGLLKNGVNFSEESMDNHWDDVTFTATNGTIATTPANGTGGKTTLQLNQFDLSAYSRIGGTGTPGEASKEPTIDGVYEGDNEVTGTGVAGSTVTVTFPDKTKKDVPVDSNNKWRAASEKSFVKEEMIEAYQVEVGKLRSGDVYETVKEIPSGNESSPEPKVDPIYVFWYDKITGYGAPGARIFVTIYDENDEPFELSPVTVDSEGTWTAKNKKPLKIGYKVVVVQLIDDGSHDPSDPVEKFVIDE